MKMTDEKSSLLSRLKDSQFRQRYVLPILLIILLVLLYARLKPEPAYENDVTICKKCGNTEDREMIVDGIKKYRCSKCGGDIGYGWKCLTCDYEFPYIKGILNEDMSIEEKRLNRIREQVCPNCGSENTYQMSKWMLEGR